MLFPLAAALVQPALKDFQGFRLDPAGAHAALFLRGNELAIFQELHMLDNGGKRHVEGQRYLAHGLGAHSQLLDNGAPCGVGQGLEYVVEIG